MKINEVEEKLNISKANIRFYEKEGLLNPEREANGYRNYSDKDIEVLKKIILLRKMGMSISDIKAVFEKELSMKEALVRTVEQLELQLAELNGSLELAKIMEKDGIGTADFDTEHYWSLMQNKETQGSKFVDVLSDYLEFEKSSLLTMWKTSFLTPLEGIFTKKGWKVTVLFILGICVLRGLGKLVFQTGTFLEGFGYPFMLFAVISLITLPLFILDYKYRNHPLPEKKASKWVTVLKVLGVLAYFPVAFGGGVKLSDAFTSSYLIKSEYYVESAWLWPIYFLVTMYLFAVLVWMYGKHGLFGNGKEKGLMCHLPARVKARVLICSIGIYFLGLFCYSCCYDCFTMEGVERRIFGYTKFYTWEDVDYYTLQRESGGTLSYIIVMEDGFQADCLGSDVASCNLPENRFPNEQEDYCIYLTQLFKEKGIPVENTDWEKLKKKLDYDYWGTYLEKLQAIIYE